MFELDYLHKVDEVIFQIIVFEHQIFFVEVITEFDFALID